MTIGEIATRAGVSKAAVSRYLNKGYLSEEKREKIRSVIEETGYAPSRQAQTLRTGKTNLVGVILPKINSETISRIVSGISQVLGKAGYQLLLADTENDAQRELSYLDVFQQERVDGVILIATFLTPQHRQAICNMPVPVVVVGQQAGFVSSVYHDDFGAARELTDLMAHAGRQRIAYIGVSTRDRAAGLQRKNGYLAALEQHALPICSDWMAQGPFTMESGYENTRQLLSKFSNIDAIFCATDFIAIGAIKFLNEKGVPIPSDICVTGIGDSQISEVITPSLTTAHYSYKTSGIEAAKMLIERMSDPNAARRELKLGFQIVLRRSAP